MSLVQHGVDCAQPRDYWRLVSSNLLALSSAFDQEVLMARHRVPFAIAAAIFALAGLAGPAAADQQAAQPTEAAPLDTHCHTIDFESAKVFTSQTMPPRHVLIVRGEKPYLNMQVKLIPLVYIRQPEYWGIEVVGCLPDVGLPAVAPYVVKLDLDGTIGTHGIEVIGATRSEKIDIPGKSTQVSGSASNGSSQSS